MYCIMWAMVNGSTTPVNNLSGSLACKTLLETFFPDVSHLTLVGGMWSLLTLKIVACFTLQSISRMYCCFLSLQVLWPLAPILLYPA